MGEDVADDRLRCLLEDLLLLELKHFEVELRLVLLDGGVNGRVLVLLEHRGLHSFRGLLLDLDEVAEEMVVGLELGVHEVGAELVELLPFGQERLVLLDVLGVDHYLLERSDSEVIKRGRHVLEEQVEVSLDGVFLLFEVDSEQVVGLLEGHLEL